MPRMTMRYPSGDAVVEMIPEAVQAQYQHGHSGRSLSRGRWRSAAIPARAPDRRRHYRLAIARGAPAFSTNTISAWVRLSAPRHASFEEIEELLLVRGMTPELFYGNYIADAEGRLYAARRPARLPLGVGIGGALRHQYRQSRADGSHGRAAGSGGRDRATVAASGRSESWAKSAQAGGPLPRLGIGGNVIWTLRATARLRRPDGTPSERSALPRRPSRCSTAS